MGYRGELDGLVLGVLQAGPAHGYELVKRASHLSDGLIKFGEAKLYPCLHRLEDAGYIESNWVPQEGKPARKVYRLTDRGRSALKQKQGEWAEFSGAVNSLLGDCRG